MVAAITSILTTLLPLLIKIVLYIIDKKADNDKLKEEFLKFLSEVETDMPVKLHDRYNDQILRIREQLKQKQEEVNVKPIDPR